MKRTGFIAAIIACITLPSFAFPTLESAAKRKDKGFKINAGEGRIHGHINLKGVNKNILDVKISGGDTSGELAIFEQTSLSPGRGTPLHIHDYQDEVFHIIEGSYLFLVGDDKYQMAAGDCIFLPKRVPHAWTQKSETGRMLVIVQPAGKLENFFLTMAALNHEPDSEEIKQIFSKNQMRVVGPALKLE